MPLPRELSEVQAATRDIILEGVRKVAVGYVTAVHGQFVDVQLTTKTPLFDETKGTTFEAAPLLGNVPWCSTRAGGFVIWVPPSAGDTCLVVYTDLSYDSWRSSDGRTQVNPGWCGRHTADSPFAIPMIAPDTNPINDAVAGTVVIGQDGGNGQIRISGTEVDLGFPATSPVAMSLKVDANDALLDTLLTAVGVFATAVGSALPPVAAAATTLNTAITAFSNAVVATGSTLVKCA